MWVCPVTGFTTGYRGASLNVAARLCGQAAPGQILATETVIALVAHMEGMVFGSPRRLQVKGMGDPVRAVELLEEYLERHAPRVAAYACYETAPLRLLARLLSEAGDVQRAAELRERARASPHRVPADG